MVFNRLDGAVAPRPLLGAHNSRLALRAPAVLTRSTLSLHFLVAALVNPSLLFQLRLSLTRCLEAPQFLERTEHAASTD
jgi:hypothetical protein